MPRAEYSYDAAVNLIVELNEQYNPSWIYCDRGAGEYQIERLHIIGDEKPTTGLKNKVKGFQFSNTLELPDPITGEVIKHPLKPFMVNQLQIAFNREMMILSPFDEVLHKQLIDYEVEKIGANGNPVFSSENEHFIDALGLAYLAMVLQFKQLTDTIKERETSNMIEHSNRQIGGSGLNRMFTEIESHHNTSQGRAVLNYDPTERPGDRPTMVKVSENYRSRSAGGNTWGSRASGTRRSGGSGRSMW